VFIPAQYTVNGFLLTGWMAYEPSGAGPACVTTSAHEIGYAHVLDEQNVPGAQTTPHPPQFLPSFVGSTQSCDAPPSCAPGSAQSKRPASHASAQLPPLHD
jgi:hypothetical protein